MKPTPEEALKRAINLVGGSAILAQKLGTTKQAVAQWDICPKGRVVAVIAAVSEAKAESKRRFKASLTARDLRPDIYGKK